MTKTRILLAQPGYGSSDEESFRSAFGASRRGSVHVDIFHKRASLLARNFNICLSACLNGGYDYFAMLHTDMAADGCWLDTLLDELHAGDYGVIHAPALIKDAHGCTSTAVAYSDDEWELRRKITSTELQRLPETFDADILREVYDPEVLYLLPNTGCLLMRADTWLKDFPGFEIKDKIVRNEMGEWEDEGVSEDWLLGYWCGRNGIPVAGTRKVVTHHFGRMDHPNNTPYGSPVDLHWKKHNQLQRA